MKKFIFLFIASVMLLNPYITKAETIKDVSPDTLVSYFEKRLNFDNFIIFQDEKNFYFCPLFDDETVVIKDGDELLLETSKNRQLSYYLIPKDIDIPDFNYTLKFDLVNSNNFIKKEDIYLSSIDILNTIDNIIHFSKNFDYKKDSVEESVEFEFPFTREEFLLIPFSVILLILMLFFRWLFPMKGGRRQ